MTVESQREAILIADDDPSDAEALQRIIRETGISNPLHAFHDGKEVIDYLAGTGSYSDRVRFPAPAFLFLDLIMPLKSGLDVLRWIREQPEVEHRFLGIVVMTGMGNVAEIREAYLLGAHSFLVKPVRKEDFMNLVHGMKGIRLDPGAAGRQMRFDLD